MPGRSYMPTIENQKLSCRSCWDTQGSPCGAAKGGADSLWGSRACSPGENFVIQFTRLEMVPFAAF